MEMMEIVFWSVQGTYVQYIRTYVLKSVKAIMICFLVDVKVSDINQGANDLRTYFGGKFFFDRSRKSRLDLSASIFLKVRTYCVHVH